VSSFARSLHFSVKTAYAILILVCYGAVRQSVRRLNARFADKTAKASKFDTISIASPDEVYYNAKRASSTDKGGKLIGSHHRSERA